ncbi:MAG: peptidoglycan DD-metalloendopeptidase family protein [Gammaproteobacteria bacterium]
MREGRRQVLLLILSLAVLSACSTYSVYAPVRDRTHAPQQNPGVHMVRSGETLFSIAWQYGLDYQTVAAWNRLSAPYTIYPGQRLGLRGPAVSAPPAPAKSPAVTRPSSPPPASASRPAPRPPAAPAAQGSALRWQWPASGPVLRPFNADASGKKGVSIGGDLGAEVRAAAAGQVVYAGSGLVGYGRLIIVKHSNIYLSAYGHNRDLRVQEGDQVRAGQVIAHMGNSGTNRIQLHFEIREKGRPVDPLRYLPRR